MEHKPLFLMLTWNRIKASQKAFASLRDTVDFNAMDIYILDNGSTDGTVEWLNNEWQTSEHNWTYTRMPNNIGAPQATNWILRLFRRPGQHFIKMDNDVSINTQGWLEIWLRYLADNPDIAMIAGTPTNDPKFEPRKKSPMPKGWFMHLVTGPFIICHGSFMDTIGYFDIFDVDHFQDYDDLILSAKANILNRPIVCLEEVTFDLDQSYYREDHQIPSRWEPHYLARVRALMEDGPIYTNEWGQPCLLSS